MVNQLYASAREKFLTRKFSWTADQFGFLLVDDGYVADVDNDYLVSTIPAASIAYRHDLLANKAATKGYAIADPLELGPITHPNTVTQIILFRQVKATDPEYLVAYIDNALNLPVNLSVTDTYLIPSGLNGAFFRL